VSILKNHSLVRPVSHSAHWSVDAAVPTAALHNLDINIQYINNYF